MKLNDLNVNETGKVLAVKAPDSIKRRLMDIGITKGNLIKPVLDKKNIRAYLIKGAVIGIRRVDTNDIEVEICE